MGTVPIPETPEPTPAEARRVYVESYARTVIGGTDVSAVRRISLYAITFAALFVAPEWGVIPSAIGAVSLAFLSLSDRDV